MQWLSLNDFFAMGGYGFYVWSSLGLTALALLLEIIVLVRQRKHTLQLLRHGNMSESKLS